MKFQKKIIILLIVYLSMLWVMSGVAFSASYELTFAHRLTPHIKESAVFFKKYVETATAGDVKIILLETNALGGAREVIDQLRLGEIDITQTNTGGLSGVLPNSQMESWPFLVADRSVAWRLMQDAQYFEFVQNSWLKDSNNKIRFLGAGENSVRHLYSTRGPIRIPADLTELKIKIRVQTIPIHVALFKGLGVFNVLTLPSGDRYMGLQTGMIDACEGGLASAWAAGLLEVTDYVSLTGHLYSYIYYVMNQDAYESLPEKYQEIINTAMILAIDIQNVNGVKADDEALDKMRDAGKIIYTPTTEELQKWQEKAVPIAQKFIYEEVDEEYIEETLAAIERVKLSLETRR